MDNQWFNGLLRGYVQIGVQGISLEKFLNLCAVNGIVLWNIRRKGYTFLRARLSPQDFMALRHVAKKLPVMITIEKKRGLPFLFLKLQGRYLFWPGAVLCMAILVVAGSFVWRVEVEGLQTLDKTQIIQVLQEEGVKEGVLLSSISPRLLEQKLLEKIHRLSFVSVYRKGVVLHVKAVEAEDKPDVIDKNEPVRIVAQKSGIIESILATYGTPRVKVGEKVQMGQTLISEEVMQMGGDIKKVHAQGSVIAKVHYSEEYHIDITALLYARTGNVAVRRYMILGNQQIIIKDAQRHFDSYQTEIKTTPLVLNYSPIKAFVVTETLYETALCLDEETVWALGQDIAKQRLDQMLEKIPPNIEIVDKSIDLSIIRAGEIFIKLNVFTREDIALKQKVS